MGTNEPLTGSLGVRNFSLDDPFSTRPTLTRCPLVQGPCFPAPPAPRRRSQCTVWGPSPGYRLTPESLDCLQGFQYYVLAMANVAKTVRRRIDRAIPGRFFLSSDFPGPRSAVEPALSRLAADDPRVVRVRRGLYWKGVNSRFGPGRPRPEEVARAVAGDRGLGPTGWSASQALGLSTQVAPVRSLVLVGPPPTGIHGVRFHSRWNFGRLGLNYEEIALFEVLRDWPDHIEASWEELVRVVDRLATERRIRLDRIRRAAEGERSLSLRERLSNLMADLPNGRRSAGSRE